MLDRESISCLVRLRDDVYSEMLVLMQRSSSMLYRNFLFTPAHFNSFISVFYQLCVIVLTRKADISRAKNGHVCLLHYLLMKSVK